jgi:hypothetical protein
MTLNVCHFFPEFELQQKRTHRRIRYVCPISCLPFEGSVRGDGSVELSANEVSPANDSALKWRGSKADYCDGVWDVVA